MSGGHFNEGGRVYFSVNHFADELETNISNNSDDDEGGAHLSEDVLSFLRSQIPLLKETARIMRHIDRLYSGDSSEESFMEAVKSTYP
jgi:hypothetical protein